MGPEIEWQMFGRRGRRIIPNILGECVADEYIGQVFLKECLPPEFYYADMKTMMSGQGLILKNGSRAYIDTGNHFEYAAEEGLGPYEALIYEKAGEYITRAAVLRANERFQKSGLKLSLFKSNLDVREVSCGLHENYSIIRRMLLEIGGYKGLLALLGPHLISRIFYTGNGWVYFDDERPRYSISQRARVTAFNLAGSAVSKRAIINTKDEDISDGGTSRLHIVCGDSVIAEPAIYLRFAVTDIILRMLEDGFLTERFLGGVTNLVPAFKAFADDPTLKKPFAFGKAKYTAVNLQERYRDRAREYFKSHMTPSAEDTRALNLWDEVIAAAKTSKPHEALAPYADWALERVIIDRDMEKRGYNWKHPFRRRLAAGDENGRRETVRYRLKNIDLSFPRLVPAGVTDNPGVRSVMKRVATDEDILAVLQTPRPSCRSYARAMQLKWFYDEQERTGNKIEVAGGWSFLRGSVEGKERVVFSSSDPYDKEMGVPIRMAIAEL